uniref:Sema domain-containing protein n=1 Tax=Glossina brevipalpis TaxID=37001 RepID=A0A1A9WX95_9MUSC
MEKCIGYEACQNYVRIMVVTSPGRLFVCGTNSFRPMCNTYIINANNYTLEATKNGQAVCPYDPRHNSTSVFAALDCSGRSGSVVNNHVHRIEIVIHIKFLNHCVLNALPKCATEQSF